MTDLQTITLHQPALAQMGEAVPYLRLASRDQQTIADVEYREAGEGEPAQIQVAVRERDAAGDAAPAMAAVFDAESGSMIRYGSTVSAATAAGVEADSLSVLAEVLKELVACPATPAQ